MADKIANEKKTISPDWFVRGVLTKLGDTFDRLTGRGWKPSSSLATSELSERLKTLVDSEVRETPEKRKYVPHNIKLKMQWDKFSTDSETALKKLETELLTALVDHINDRRYYTYAPITLEVKPDYFTDGVKLFASFEEGDKDENEASLNVTVPNIKIDLPIEAPIKAESHTVDLKIRFRAAGKQVEKVLNMQSGKRFSVGRTKESDVAIDDSSVSKMHATLLLNSGGDLVVADTGSTNGTFLGGERIAYGKAITFSPTQGLRFGSIEVELEMIEIQRPPKPATNADEVEIASETVKVGGFEFTRRIDEPAVGASLPAPTVPSIQVPEPSMLKPMNPDRERVISDDDVDPQK